MKRPAPNIVVVLVDDTGACDLGFYGNPDAETPRLDALAWESLRHEAFCVTPVCAPTRAAFLTGRHHLRTGVSHVHGGKDYLSRGERTVAEVLGAAGYATGLWGKWHNGITEGYLPHQRGFDETLRLQLYRHRDPVGTLASGEKREFDGRWADDVIVDHCLDFARRCGERPFFGVVASMTPHGPLDAPADVVARMEARGMSPRLARLHGQMSGLDAAVGRLVDGLRNLDAGGRETAVVFFSDNGPAMFENAFTDADRERRNVLRWRGWKGDVWENGVRTPLFVHWPGRFAPGDVAQPADVTDLLPTFAAWAGAELLEDQRPLDGRDITPLLDGERLADKPIFHWVHPAIPPVEGAAWAEQRERLDEYRPVQPREKAHMAARDQVMAIRRGAWKLVFNGDANRDADPGMHLGDLIDDPREVCNLRDERPGVVARLSEELERWWEDVRDEGAAFRPPRLVIAAEGVAFLRATCVSRHSPGLRNGVGVLAGFGRAGDVAAWDLESQRSRSVAPVLEWGDANGLPVGARVRLECSGSVIEGLVRGGGGLAWDGNLCVDAGPTTLELRVVDWPAAGSDVALWGITFQPAEEEMPEMCNRDAAA